MPGIAGIISNAPADICRSRVVTMVQSMMHEPFYVSGICCAPSLGAYVGWVAHPGSFAAEQSSTGAVHEVALALAGECFPDRGANRRPEGPPESERPLGYIAQCYRQGGVGWLAALNGSFSGLLVDLPQRRVMLFNDRYATERLYVHQTDSATYFASEAKALLRVLPDLRRFDDDGVAEFLSFGCPRAGRTLFRGIRCLEGGSVWSFGDGSCAKSRYFTPDEWQEQPSLTEPEFESAFETCFKRILPRYLHSEGPIGVSLTAGLDTRMIMACLPDLAPPPLCYTFSGPAGLTRDADIAATVASACSLEHQVLRIGDDFLSGYGDYVEHTVYVTDGCSGPLGAHEIYLNALAREQASIRLTGNFGSEVLRGVSAPTSLGLATTFVPTDLCRRATELAGQSVASSQPAITSALFHDIPHRLFGTLAAARSQVVFRTPYLDNELVSLAYRAPDGHTSDAALRLIAHNRPSLSLIPTDRALVIGGGGVGYAAKRLYAEATFKLDYLHTEALPGSRLPLDGLLRTLGGLGLLGIHKYLPYRLWFRRQLSGYVTAILTDIQAQSPYWSSTFLATLARDHISGRRNYLHELNAAITLALVAKMMFRSESISGKLSDAMHSDGGAVDWARR